MNIPTCISYIRFSSERQSLGNSLERQLKLSRDYAAKHGYVIDERFNYQDLGVSAFTGENAKFGDLHRFLSAIKNGEIPRGSILLVESLDRLSRENVSEAYTQFQAILKEDIKVVTLGDEMEYTKESMDSDFGKLIISLSIMMRANEESKIKSMRIRQGLEKKRQNLANVKMTANAPTWLKLVKETNTFELVPERVEIIRKIFKMSFNGLGIITIARQLNKDKIPAFRSTKGWYQSTVRKILSSRSVIGEYQPHIYRKGMKKPEPVGELVINYYPSIVDKEIYYAVQARLSNGTHVAGRTAKIENIFGGITVCGYCGARMDVVTKGKYPNDIRALVCTSARSGVGCSYVSIKCNELENAFLTFCRDKELIDVLHLEGMRDKENKGDLLLQLSAKQGELLNINKRINILDEEILDSNNKLTRLHFKEVLNDALQTKIDLETAIEGLSREITNINLTFEDVDTRVNNILDTVKKINESASEEDRIAFRGRLRNNLRQIIKRVVVYPRGHVASDDQILKFKTNCEFEISQAVESDVYLLTNNMQQGIEQMRLSQNNNKDRRYFDVFFNNSNFRRFIFDIETNSYYISHDKTGSTLSVWSKYFGKMVSMVVDNEDEFIKYSEYLRNSNPELSEFEIKCKIDILRQMETLESNELGCPFRRIKYTIK